MHFISQNQAPTRIPNPEIQVLKAEITNHLTKPLSGLPVVGAVVEEESEGSRRGQCRHRGDYMVDGEPDSEGATPEPCVVQHHCHIEPSFLLQVQIDLMVMPSQDVDLFQ